MFATVAIYVCDEQTDTIEKRIKAYGSDYAAIHGPGDKNGCVFVLHDVPVRGRDHGFLTQELFRGLTAYDYLMLMQHITDPSANEVHGLAWSNPYHIDFVCKRYIAVNGEAVIKE